MKNKYSLVILVSKDAATTPLTGTDFSNWTCTQMEAVPDLIEAFEESYAGELSKQEKKNIEKAPVLLLVEGLLETPEQLRDLYQIFWDKLGNNAYGFYIQSCGKSLLVRDVIEVLATEEQGILSELFVQYFWDDDKMLTQGLDSIGLPDFGIQEDDPKTAQDTLYTILSNCLEGNGILQEGEKFLLPDQQKYRLKAEPTWELDEEEIGYNPFGTLRLVTTL